MSPIYLATFVLFSFWDYYIPSAGGRVLDYAGLLLIALSLMPRIAFGDWRPLSFTGGHFLLLLTMSPLIGLGIVRGSFLTAAAFLIGCAFVYALYFTKDIDYERVYRQLGWLIVLHLIAFYVQYVTFKASGYLINYHAWIGVTDPRVLVGGIIRAAGFFQEPNGFCQTLFMLNAIRLFCPRVDRDYLFPISIITLLLSESLWGIGAAIFLTLCRMYVSEVKAGRFPLVVLSVTGTALLAGFLIDWSLILSLIFSPVTVSRLLDVSNDPSAQVRFSGAGGFSLDPSFFLGHGPSTEDFQTYLGVNAISFYIYGFGFLGLLLFLLFLLRVSNGNGLSKVLIVLFAMTTYPLFTYAFWWAWLAILLKANSEELARTGQWRFVGQHNRVYQPSS